MTVNTTVMAGYAPISVAAVSGASPISDIAESTIGDMSTTSAAVGIIIVAIAVRT